MLELCVLCCFVHASLCERCVFAQRCAHFLKSIACLHAADRIQQCKNAVINRVMALLEMHSSLQVLCMPCYAMLCYAMLCYAMLCYAMLCCSPVSSQEAASCCAGTEGCTMQPSRIGQSHTPGSSSCTSYTLLSASGAQSPPLCLEPMTGPTPAS